MIRRIQNVIRRHGFAGAARAAVRKLWDLVSELGPQQRRIRRTLAEFDRQYGVDTSTKVPASALGVAGESALHACGYQTTSVEAFHRILRAIPVRHEAFTFIDIGSGKGRALLLASHYPFKRIIGVEFSERLVQIARRNIRIYRDARQQCREIEVVCIDAAEYAIPEGNVLLYLYNPFDEVVMARFLANVQRVAGTPRMGEIWVAYVNPLLRQMFDEAPLVPRVENPAGIGLYRAGIAPAAAA